MILEWFSRFLPTASELEKEDTLPDTDSEPTNTTLDRLLPYTCPDAAVDSSARDPPPRCHPGTRQRILDTLNDWLINHLWKIFWLSGPAGTGKSAIAQTFAEICLEQGRLGAAYFFFRSSGRNDPRTVIPTLAYQLAVNVPDYGNLLGHAIALDPSIFQKTPRVQLRKLIVEPFTRLQTQGHRSTQTPLLIVLDGLDECQGIQAQCDIVEMIGEVVRLKKDFPILWLIMSRPEPHLQYIFSRADFSIECKKETLLIDADTRDDVDRYLRDSFIDIRRRFPLVTDVAWPSQAQSQTVEDIASGLFALAATIIRYISDIAHGDPMGRLGDFLAFMTNTNYATATNPLQTLDLLYSQILSEIPENVYLRTKQILSLYQISNLEVLCAGNLLCMANHEFYNALSKLHSLFDVPSPGEAQMTCLIMYHTSFGDYLLTPFRSGRFHISREYIVVDCFKALFFWYKVILQDPLFVSDGPFGMIADSVILPGLKWTSSDNGDNQVTSKRIAIFVSTTIWRLFLYPPHTDPIFFHQWEAFDFRYIMVNRGDIGEFATFLHFLFTSDPCNTLLHTGPQDELEKTLLEKVVREIDRHMKPAVLPMVKINIYLHRSWYPVMSILVRQGTASAGAMST
ncbi:hypothetical protein AGABI1DRAFT_89766 [Agaricus bisporus var. burnettii JB137-S8]|uniref:Nephrocystin 3-like N-terminal domain-containing protein n=1 Tax=Agaricus bisporus var. burnettii (strain JB137-S8 / ATCC MYA-4627 / FGSC 10392) TaxID=597362 RepID=K5W8K3_AGABU|nr:uncharacterized protein AGABI1DRAFT_89766 [Agaricus bisporus var. burnettii JB137-S8]EKM83179.1 hypothetical protein AGABI1DRAFT_89766 [Agaricus bisporus var. burnettii JB137-S8]